MTTQLAAFEDGALIKLALAGHAECFTHLVDRHLTAIKRCIGSMVRNATDADDLLQEVLFKVWHRLSTFRSEASFRTWMTRVAVNEVLQSHRRERRCPTSRAFGDLDCLTSPGESPHRSLARVEAIQMVRGAVAGLPEIYRQVLILRDLEEFSVRETAQRLQSPIPTIKSRLFRARRMLRAALRHE
jgi:RNA polymerase sigma-70 factor (ECF subfamily)